MEDKTMPAIQIKLDSIDTVRKFLNAEQLGKVMLRIAELYIDGATDGTSGDPLVDMSTQLFLVDIEKGKNKWMRRTRSSAKANLTQHQPETYAYAKAALTGEELLEFYDYYNSLDTEAYDNAAQAGLLTLWIAKKHPGPVERPKPHVYQPEEEDVPEGYKRVCCGDDEDGNPIYTMVSYDDLYSEEDDDDDD